MPRNPSSPFSRLVAVPRGYSAARKQHQATMLLGAILLSLVCQSGCTHGEEPTTAPATSTAQSPSQISVDPVTTTKPSPSVGGHLAAKETAKGKLFTPQPPGKRLIVVYTASVEGYVAPCGCTAEPLGGVARLAALLTDAKAAYGDRVLFVDAGNLLFERADDNLPADVCQAKARIDLLLSTYARMGLAATVPGPFDDARGPKFREDVLTRHKIPSVNVMTAQRKTDQNAIWHRSLVEKRGDVLVGVTGFVVENPAQVATVRQALQAQVVALIAKGVDAVVVMAQSPRPLTEQVATDLNEIDLVIQGRAPGELPSAPKRLGTGGPVLVSAGAQAQHAGIVTLDLRERMANATGGRKKLVLDDSEDRAKRRAHLLQARVVQYQARIAEMEQGPRRDFIALRLKKAQDEMAGLGSNEAPPLPPPSLRVSSVALTRASVVEEKAGRALAAYQKAIPDLVRGCEENITCPEVPEGQATYVGVQTCFECHAQAVKFWQQQRVNVEARTNDGRVIERSVGHSKAWQTLTEIGKEKDRQCVGCHSIGFNQPGGYCRTSDVEFRTDVQCESCHGPASLHVDSGGDSALLVRQGVPEETCRGCHRVPHIPSTKSFVYQEKLHFILGKGHGEEQWNKLPTLPNR